MIHLLLGLKWVNCQGIISIYYRKWPCNRYNIIKMFWVTMIHVPFLAFFDIREWSESISVHCVSVKQIPLLVQGFENLFFLLLKLWAYMTLFICKCQIKLLKQRLLLLITQTHTHTCTPKSTISYKILIEILSLEKFGTKWAAKTKYSLL